MARTDAEVLERQVDILLWLEKNEATFAELATSLKAATENQVLFSGTVILDSSGSFTRDWPVSFASFAVRSHVANELTVVAGPLQASAPIQGEGVYIVGPNGHETINAHAHVITVYGAEGDALTLQVFTRPQPPTGASIEPITAVASGSSGAPGPVAIAQNVASVVLAAANSSRKGGVIWNNSAANLYVTFGATSSTTLWTVKVGPGLGFDLGGQSIYSGIISGIWDAAGAGNAMVTELA